jgi:hypothetical protein
MPGRDRTGPMGQGSGTGRGAGDCGGFSRGRGFGRRRGRRFGAGAPGLHQSSPREEADRLRSQIEELEGRLARLERQD